MATVTKPRLEAVARARGRGRANDAGQLQWKGLLPMARLAPAPTPQADKADTLRLLSRVAKTIGDATSDDLVKAVTSVMAQLSETGFHYDPAAYSQLMARTKAGLDKQHPQIVAPRAHALIDQLTRQPVLDIGEFELLDIGRDGQEPEAMAIVKDEFNDFRLNGRIDGPALAATERAQLRRDLRVIVRRTIKAETVADMLRAADSSMKGFVAGLNEAIAAELAKGQRSIFNAVEKDMLSAVRSGSKPWQVLAQAFGLPSPIG
ncbi:hypothetical protein MesoLjLc_58990 [Mesorhizobium sp. L-8-10]|uniref:hypothetical protein n=1 Tax=Mesorhizobium sp. L-8-10 TaxID=2744523 RepID=UPI001928441C|nr:hypothetical protein [Mesorhizobium sp. L-8-10]BCH33969.1 hypothetical protein MesoLjLc_58990 [Mesorhizobium sp. L-8-10]